MMKIRVGIDPGKSGGIVALAEHSIGLVMNTINAWKSIEHSAQIVEQLKQYGDVHALIENVHAFPSDGRSSAFKFGHNAGCWEGILAAHKITYSKVVPHKWMSFYGEMPKVKQERKNHLKALAQNILDRNGLPYKATLKNADALLIAYYQLRSEDEE